MSIASLGSILPESLGVIYAQLPVSSHVQLVTHRCN
jgi:hypothetical protein